MNCLSAGAECARPSTLSLIQDRHAKAPDASNSGIADLPSVTMTLTGIATSDAAKAAMDTLAAELVLQGPARHQLSGEYIIALQAVIADLLIASVFEAPTPCFRPMRAATFNGLRVGYRGCRRAIDDLHRHGYIIVSTGVRPQHGRRGTVTRIVPTIALLDRLKPLGIMPADRLLHFTYGPSSPPPVPIRLKGKSSKGFVANREGRYRYDKIPGEVIPINQKDPTVLALLRPIADLNEYMRGQRITLDRSKLHNKDRNLHLPEQVYFYRGFNNGDDPKHNWKMGGRINAESGHYQTVRKKSRPALLVNGEATVEVDISSCHLTLTYAALKEPLPVSDDLYSVNDIDRKAIKLFVNSLLSAGKPPSRWDQAYGEAFDEDDPKRLGREWPIAVIGPKTMAAMPILQRAIDTGISWSYLQHVESNIMLKTVHSLCIERNVCALPLHDSVIVPAFSEQIAYECLSTAFFAETSIYPILKTK